MAIISSNEYLSVNQMVDNAQYILNYMTANGWTKNAICGMLGNMQTESTMNPGLWESRKYGNMSGGYGLVQWTPATEYTNWADANGYEWGDIKGQLECILHEVPLPSSIGQWIPTSSYPMTFPEFTKSTESPEYLAKVFIRNYERPKNPDQPIRSTQARFWFDNITGDDGSQEVIQKAIDWALAIAADDSHGYDQAHRDGPNYDCSSFISWAYYNAGVNTRPGYTPGTGMMYDVFTAAGFNDVTGQINLDTGEGAKPGDVFLQPGSHTAMYIGNGMMVHASINEFGEITGGQSGDQTGKEICTRTYYNKPWTYVLRYKSGGGGGVIVPTFVSLVNWIPA